MPLTPGTARSPDAAVDTYWSWVAVVCFLLLTVDLLTTVYAAAVVGTGAEANPLVAWALEQGPAALVALNLGVLAVVAVLFAGLRETIEHTPPAVRSYYELLVLVWLWGLVIAGFVIFANNVSVIVLRRSLLPALG